MGKKSKKYYAVKIGLVPGLYLTWGECQQNINGFSGAVYKSFDMNEAYRTRTAFRLKPELRTLNNSFKTFMDR